MEWAWMEFTNKKKRKKKFCNTQSKEEECSPGRWWCAGNILGSWKLNLVHNTVAKVIDLTCFIPHCFTTKSTARSHKINLNIGLVSGVYNPTMRLHISRDTSTDWHSLGRTARTLSTHLYNQVCRGSSVRLPYKLSLCLRCLVGFGRLDPQDRILQQQSQSSCPTSWFHARTTSECRWQLQRKYRYSR